MSDLSKIEAWIQQQDDELLYDADDEDAYRRSYREMLDSDIVLRDAERRVSARMAAVPLCGRFSARVVGSIDDRSNSE